jgi:hypothetical protein
MNRADQEAFLKNMGLPQANLEDLAAAFMAHWVATGEPLFGWYDQANEWSFVVRAAGGALNFDSLGLDVDVIDDDVGDSGLAVASRVPLNSKTR